MLRVSTSFLLDTQLSVHDVGSIMAGTAITFGTKSELQGCALAQSAVTFESEGSVVLNHYEADGIYNAKINV